jgi:pyruvate kinase
VPLDHRFDDVTDLAAGVAALRDAMLAAEQTQRDWIEATHPRHRRSAANLVHYVELRRHDIRELQSRLSAMGLSSLGRSESHVLASLEAVLAVLDTMAGRTPTVRDVTLSIGEGDFLLATNATDLLGPQPAGRLARIMVTLPSEAADDGAFVESLVDAGMDVARVNCAHDDPDAWVRMVGHVRRAGRDAPLVAMDLAGPKLRTGPLPAGPAVLKIRPQRSAIGEVVRPAHVHLVPDAPGGSAHDGDVTRVIVDDAAWISRRVPGELVELTDARGSRRKWTVLEADASECVVSSEKTTYVTNGTALTCRNDPTDAEVFVGGIAATQQRRRVERGDRVVLTRELDLPDEEVDQLEADGAAAVVGCTLPALFDAAAPAEPIWFDDGKIGGVVESVTPDRIDVRITDVRAGGTNLKSEKGINVPDTALAVDALTAKDVDDLDVVAEHADIVNLSFVRDPADVRRLQDELVRRDAAHVGIVLKIENLRAFENLPQLLLTAMAFERVGVMIARGDLAVEVGFERLAEVQEEIMWACEAAHVPVIWATQVLESLAKTGRPSRAEVTDAAMSVRAECVMLNKGPHILDAMAALDSILSRMGEHHRKKRSMLRRLTSWDQVDLATATIDETVSTDERAPELGDGLSAPR